MSKMRTRARWTALVASVGLVASLAACADSGESSGDQKAEGEDQFVTGIVRTEGDGDPVAGGTLTFGAFSEPTSLDPARAIVAGSTGGVELAAIFDVLMRYDVESDEVVPQLAEGLEGNDDATEWVLTLRDEVAFTDGTQLDADAVVASIERYLDAGSGDTAVWQENVKSTEVTGPLEVTITLKRSWPGFPSLLAGGIGMIVAESSGPVGAPKYKPVGAGAFEFVEHRPQEKIVLEANADYWDGAPHLDGVEVVFINDPNAIGDSMRTGQVQLGFLRDPKAIYEALEGGFGGTVDVVAGGKVLVLNAADGRPTADVRVRRAISAALDPKVVVERAQQGYGVPTSSMFPASSPIAPDVDVTGVDLEEAKKLVEEAKADGFDGELSLVTANSPDLRAIAQTIQALLGAAGIELKVDYVPSSTETVAKVVGGDYDAAAWGLSWRESEPYQRLFVTLHSAGNANYGWATSPELDEAIEAVQQADGADAVKESLGRVQEVYEELMPAVPFGAIPEYVGWLPSVHGVQGTLNSMVLLDDAWLEQ